jgi:hypothetical protein
MGCPLRGLKSSGVSSTLMFLPTCSRSLLTATRSSKPPRRIPLHPPRLWLPFPARMAAQHLSPFVTPVLSRCHNVAHRQDKRACRHRRAVLPKLTLPHVRKAHPLKVIRANLFPDSLVKVYTTWGSRAVHLRRRRLSRPEGSSVGSGPWTSTLSIIYSTFPLCTPDCYLLL